MVSWQTTTASLLGRLTIKQLLQREVSVDELRVQIGAIERLFADQPPGFEVARNDTAAALRRRVVARAGTAGPTGDPALPGRRLRGAPAEHGARA